MTPPPLRRLPAELLIAILDATDFKTLLACQLACKALQYLITNTAGLQYIIFLAACGMRRKPHQGRAVSEALAKLQAHDVAWRNLDWTAEIKFPEISTPVETIDGVLEYVPKSNPDNPDEYDPYARHYRQLSSTLRAVEEKAWELNIPRPERGWLISLACDPSEDLLVLVEDEGEFAGTLWQHFVRLHFLSLSSGLPHPSSALPVLDHTDIHAMFFVRKSPCGELVNLFNTTRLSELTAHTLIWNWKQGEFVTRLHVPVPNCFTTRDFEFIDERYALILTDSVPHTLYLYDMFQPDVYDTQGYSLGPPPVVAFHFLSLGNARPPLRHDIRCNKTASSSPSASSALNSGLFSTNPRRSLVRVFLSIEGPHNLPSGRVDIVFPTQRLLSFAPTQVPFDEPTTRIVPWNEWGPAHAHLTLLGPNIDFDEGRVLGMKYVCPSPVLGDDGLYVVEVRDYDPRRVARAEQLLRDCTDEERASQRWTVRYGGVAEAECFPDGPITTRLPYVESRRPLPDFLQAEQYAQISLSLMEDGIIAKTGAPNEIYAWTF